MKALKLFIYYSIMGFLFENIATVFTREDFNSGVLKGPFTPLYFSGMILIMLLNLGTDKIKNKKTRVLVYFISITLILTILEFLCGHLIECTEHKVFWDYSKFKGHIGKYIAVEVSLVWGILATIYNYKYLRKVNRFIAKMDNKLTLALLSIYLLDVFLTYVVGKNTALISQ